jgi:6-phosphogluconolactonase (cycloisomerase 2 family)
LSLIGRIGMALFASLALGLGMTACGGGTIAYMWILGQQYNNIAGFKVDDYTGNLTQIQESPFDSNGAMPVSIVIKTGGRFVYVINQGTCPTAGCSSGTNVGQTIALFSVGGDGTLNFQQSYQSQGYDSQWAQMDASGTYLYVLDKYSPGYILPNTPGYPAQGGFIGPNTDSDGSITAFAADPTTGRLSLVTNAQTLKNNVNTPFWEVGPSPFMMKTSSGCLFTVNGANQTISPFAVGASGQLAFTTTGIIPTVASKITSINGGGSYIFLTDAGSNSIDGYTVGGTCNLVALSGGGVIANFPGTSNPMYTFLDSTGQYLYVLNQSTTTTQVGTPYSSISAYTITAANQELQPIAGAPYTVGSGPVCMVEDSTNQYLYTSNHNDGTVSGKVIDPSNGTLADLHRGSTFPSVGLAGCLALSGAID